MYLRLIHPLPVVVWTFRQMAEADDEDLAAG